MKTILLITMGLVTFSWYPNQTMKNDAEIEFLFNYLDESYNHLSSTLSAIDDDLWTYKPKDGGWSIAECVDHIWVAENGIFMGMQKSLEADADNSKNLKPRDGLVVTFVSDRGKVTNTPLPAPAPSMTKEEFMKSLADSRMQIKEFLTNNRDQLRNHFGQAPFGEVDTYQLGLVVAGHGMRHTAQIKQIIGEYTGEAVQY
ncbi:MAG: DinB family protein [bacterium]|nr:DinB family protein [bacterium]